MIRSGCDNLEGDIAATAVMANAWYNFPLSGNFGVYVGGDAGLTDVEISEENIYVDDDSMEFIWQVGGGVNFRTASGYAFGVGYRHVEIGDVGGTGIELKSDEVIVELSRRF